MKLSTELILKREKILEDYAKVQELIDALPEKIPEITVSEAAEKYRTLPSTTPFPGRWRNDLTPYLVEIMDCLSVRSPIQEVVWSKCSQIGATAAVENFIAYIIRVAPGPTLYCTAKEDLLGRWANKRLSPLIISCGLDGVFSAQHTMKGQRRTGNKMLSKEFPGGSLDLISAQSESNLRMDSIRYLILDEAGAYPWNLQGFGDPIAIARARTANYGSRKKIFIPSTPRLEGECRMWPLFTEWDQRRYFVPCPFCGEFQVLRFPSEPDVFYEGFRATKIGWEMKGGSLDKKSIHFLCDSCGEAFFERHKVSMVTAGKWAPTAKSTDSTKRSYQIGRLYSLMDKWYDLVKMEIKGATSHEVMQAHHNHNCGIPYRQPAVSVDKSRIYELRGGYESGAIPSEKVLFLTASVDVQLGKSDDPDSPPRLEMEVCGHGKKHRTWSLMYKVFPGDISDPFDGAWEDLYQFFSGPDHLRFSRSDGLELWPMVVFVDSGVKSTEVFEFCQRLRGFYPIKGFQELKESKQGEESALIFDEAHRADQDRYRLKDKGGVSWVEISTNWYKRQLLRALRTSIRQKETSREGANFCDFPSDYPDKYFDMLTAEEERADHTFFRVGSRPNEALDLRVYNLAAGDFFLWMSVQKTRADLRRRGATHESCKAVQATYVLNILEDKVKRRDVTPEKAPSRLAPFR